MLYDAKPEAAENIATVVKRSGEARAKLLSELTWPVSPAQEAMVVGRYANADLGPLTIAKENGKLMMQTNAIRSELATKRNEDGTHSVVSVDPGFWGADVLIAEREGKRALILNDSQHEYVWVKE